MRKLLTILCFFVSVFLQAQIYTVPYRGQAGVIRIKPDRGLPNSINVGGQQESDGEQAATYTFDATGTASSYAANSLSADFDNEAGTSSLSGGVRYIKGNTDPGFELIGKVETRDQEVTSNVSAGSLYLRITTAGKGFFFTMNPAGNKISIGIYGDIPAVDPFLFEAK